MKLKNLKTGKTSIFLYIIVVVIITVILLIRIFVIDYDPTLNNKELAIEKCIDLCIQQNAKEPIPNTGPCLSDEVVAGWACDTINDPRVSYIDDRKDNQCTSGYKHIVELNTNCKLINAE